MLVQVGLSELFGNHIVGFPTRRLIYGHKPELPCIKEKSGKLNFVKVMQVGFSYSLGQKIVNAIKLPRVLVEPRREKTGLRGFRPGPTQTGLYSLRNRLEA